MIFVQAPASVADVYATVRVLPAHLPMEQQRSKDTMPAKAAACRWNKQARVVNVFWFISSCQLRELLGMHTCTKFFWVF